MKCANVSPIYKKGDSQMKQHYRPVSILTGLSKIFESVINEQLIEHFNSIFNKLISAFRRGHSCQSLLIRVIEDWKKSLDNGDMIGAVFMDLSRAFDCLPHSLLIAKLHACGIDEGLCELLCSYLSQRKQRVKLGNHKSTWHTINKGVP